MRARCGRSYLPGMTEITSTKLEASPPSGAWLRIFALLYDPFCWLGEIAGMRSRRSALLGNPVGGLSRSVPGPG